MTSDEKPEPFAVLRSLFGARVERASSSMYGGMPLRAHQLCLPLTAASGFGWAVFPPIAFALLFDGTSILWRPMEGEVGTEEDTWHLLSPTAHLPGTRQQWLTERDGLVMPDAPPMLDQDSVIKNLVSFGAGVCARTRPGWALLTRPVPNLPGNPGVEVLEGIIETDWFFAPIFIQLRLRQTDMPIVFTKAVPMFTLQPVHRSAYDEANLKNVEITAGLDSLTAEEWREVHASFQRRTERKGYYKHQARVEAKRYAEAAGSCPLSDERPADS